MADSEVELALLHKREALNNTHERLLTSIQAVHEYKVQQKAKAEGASSVIASQAHFENNSRFNEINNNMDARVRVSSNMHALNPEEIDCYSALLTGCKTATITPAITHCINTDGDIQGFRFECGLDERASCLPMNRELFFNTVMVECMAEEGNDIALKVQMFPDKCIQTLEKLAGEICASSKAENKAGFGCMPDNTDSVVATGGLMGTSMEPLLGSSMCRKVADCMPWQPEPPRFMGLYHAYTRNYQEDFRRHKLFIVVGGGCGALSDEYYNLVVGGGDSLSVRELHDSVETWWCKKANHRSNCRLLHSIAQRFSLDVPEMLDPFCYDETWTCCPTLTTYHNDISISRNRFGLFNNCMDPSASSNGVLFHHHADEGLWIFKGYPKTNDSANIYGGPFGVQGGNRCFPTSVPPVSGLYSWDTCFRRQSLLASRRMATIKSRDGPAISRMNQHGEVLERSNSARQYTLVDESFLNGLQADCKWQREYGTMELMPIAAVYIDP